MDDKERKDRSIKRLKKLLTKGTKLFGVVKHKTETRKYYAVYVIDGDDLIWITGHIAIAISPSYSDKYEAIVTNDPDLIAYHLGCELYGDGHAFKWETL